MAEVPTSNPPLVSFILLAFNQEKFIDAAIDGALKQDYPNLEIVFSDDASSDSTFAIMERRAAEYRGPHRIVLNRTAGGGGIVAHFYTAVAKSRGRFIIAAAGDDVSCPQRTKSLVKAWIEGATAVYSAFDRIDEHGAPLASPNGISKSDYDPSVYFAHRNAPHISGVSAAYDREVFERVALPSQSIMAEDYFFSLMLGLRSLRAVALDEPLVAYRIHQGAISSADETVVGVEEMERRSAMSAGWVAALLRLLDHEAKFGGLIDPGWGTPAEIDQHRLSADIAYLDYRAQWLSKPFPARLAALARFAGPRRTRWLAARLLGVPGLVAMKRARRAIGRLVD